MSKISSEKKASLFEKFMPVLLFVTVVLAFLVGVLWQKVDNLGGGKAATNNTADNAQPAAQPTVDLDKIKDLFSKDLITIGNKNEKVIFVEVSDPSCPYCHVAGGLNPELNTQVGPQFTLVADGGTYVAPVIEMRKLVESGKASFVWIYQNGHGNGELATKSLYCADEKGKFWEVHDLLMTSKGYDLINNTVKNDVAQAGTLANFLSPAFDSSDMKKCLESGKYDDRLASDMVIARELGASGTPGFFINETNFAGAYSYTDMQSVVDAALN